MRTVIHEQTMWRKCSVHMSVGFVFMHGFYEVNISKILAVTTLRLDDVCIELCIHRLTSDAHGHMSLE